MLGPRRGFTMIEVLVTLVILLFGLLGIAGMMAKGQRAAYEALQRQQALAMVADMAERILGNRTQAAAYATAAPLTQPAGASYGLYYADLLKSNITNCAGANCTAADLQRYDIAMWEGLMLGYSERMVAGTTSVGGILNANGCIVELANTSANCPAAPAAVGNLFTRTMRISVAWQGSEDSVDPSTISGNTNMTCGNGSGYRSTTSRRIVATDINVMQNCP